jgi:hypothetical protein
MFEPCDECEAPWFCCQLSSCHRYPNPFIPHDIMDRLEVIYRGRVVRLELGGVATTVSDTEWAEICRRFVEK